MVRSRTMGLPVVPENRHRHIMQAGLVVLILLSQRPLQPGITTLARFQGVFSPRTHRIFAGPWGFMAVGAGPGHRYHEYL